MFCVMMRRSYRQARDRTGGDRFAARSGTNVELTMSGPFQALKTAERAAAQAMGTSGCLEAQVLTEQAVKAIVAKSLDYPYDLVGAARKMLALLQWHREEADAHAR